MLADHDWWAAPAMPMMMMGSQIDIELRGWARSARRGNTAKMSIAFMRAAYGSMLMPLEAALSMKMVGSLPP